MKEIMNIMIKKLLSKTNKFKYAQLIENDVPNEVEKLNVSITFNYEDDSSKLVIINEGKPRYYYVIDRKQTIDNGKTYNILELDGGGEPVFLRSEEHTSEL